jgi:16S rRNA (guanine527-N7)-methyltransferase
VDRFDLRDLQVWLRSFGVELSQQQLDQSQTFLDTLLLWNRRMNLVAQAHPHEIIVKHLADAFVAASLLQPIERLIDLGSGGGFPGIPCAIYRPGASIHLVESNQKKATFLSEAARLCGLARATVLDRRIEEVRNDRAFGGIFTVVMSRALWKVSRLLPIAESLLAPGGRLIAMKGPEYRAELKAIESERYALERVVPYRLPDESSRVLLVFCFT